MERIKQMLGMLLALCLLLPSAGPAETAESPESAEKQMIISESGDWPPELIGCWAGLYEDFWRQFIFLKNGKYIMTVFEDPGMDETGTSETIGGADRITVQGDLMYLTVGGTTGIFRRMPDLYIRIPVTDGAITPSVDPALLGTFSGRIGEDYVEWTFRGDGRFTRLTPYQALKEEGFYIAGSGSLAILLNGKIINCAYKARENFITLDLPDIEKVILSRRNGQLTEMLMDEDGDFGWMWPIDWQEPRGLVLCRYLDIETEVGIPGTCGFIPVLGIGDGAFKGNKTVRSVTVPAFVTDIGSSAFEGCESLKDVLFFGTHTDMGYKVLGDDLSSYERIGLTVIPGSCPLKTIGESAFRGCSSLENLNIAKNAVQSPHSIYWWIGRSDVKGINIPDGVTGIGANAFEGCVSITSVAIPCSVTSIGKDAFKGCENLTFIVAEDSYAYNYAKRNGIPFLTTGD